MFEQPGVFGLPSSVVTVNANEAEPNCETFGKWQKLSLKIMALIAAVKRLLPLVPREIAIYDLTWQASPG